MYGKKTRKKLAANAKQFKKTIRLSGFRTCNRQEILFSNASRNLGRIGKMLVKKKIKENCSLDCKINNEDNITRTQVELDSKQCYNLKLQYASKLTTLK